MQRECFGTSLCKRGSLSTYESILIPNQSFHWLPGGGVQHLTNPQENCSDYHADARDSHMDVRFGAGDWQRN